jgi:hypothetical protein
MTRLLIFYEIIKIYNLHFAILNLQYIRYALSPCALATCASRFFLYALCPMRYAFFHGFSTYFCSSFGTYH